MLDIARSVYHQLAANADLTYNLATYRSGPAIFTGMLVPPNASRPYVTMSGNVADVDEDAQGVDLREIVRDVGCYADWTGSDALIDLIAEQVRAALHGQTFAISGGGLLVCRCSGPVVAPTDRTLVGRIVTASFLVYVA